MNSELGKIKMSAIPVMRDRLLQMDDPIRLESGEPSFDTPEHIKEGLIQALRDNHTHYPPSAGIQPLRESILRKVHRDNGVTYLDSIDAISVTPGGTNALYATFRAMLNPGDEVILPRPNWVSTARIVALAGGSIRYVDLKPELNYRWDLDEVEAAITPASRVILINSPQNPTGGLMTASDLRGILEIAARHDLYVIADEAYEHIVYEGEHVSIAALAGDFPPEDRARIVSCFTFSKSYAMTGWRVGYVVTTNEDLLAGIRKMVGYTNNGVATPVQYGALAALDGPQECVTSMCAAYRENRDLLHAGLQKSSFLECPDLPSGTFYLYARITDTWEGSDWDLVNSLVDTHALGSVPGAVFGDQQAAIRFSYACSTDMVRRAIDVLGHAAGLPVA